MAATAPTAGRGTAVAVGGAGLLAVAYLTLPGDGARAAIWAAVAMLGTVALLLLTARLPRPARPSGWFLAGGVSLLAAGQAGALVAATSPSYADLSRLLGLALLAAGVSTFQRSRAHSDTDSLLDSLVVTVAAAQAGWLFLIDPILGGGRDDPVEALLVGGDLLAGLLLLGVTSRLGFRVPGTADRGAHLLLAGLSVGLLTGLAPVLVGTPVVLVGWFVALGLIVAAVAAGVPTTDLDELDDGPPVGTVWRFVVLLGLACLVSPVLVVTQRSTSGATRSWVVLGAAMLLFTLALLRIVSLLGRLRRTLRREHVLRTATGSLVSAADREGVRDAALAAALDLLNQQGTRAWRVDGDPGGTVAQATENVDLATFLDSSELALFPQNDTGIAVQPGPSVLHAAIGAPPTSTLVLIGLPPRGTARDGAIIAVSQRPSPSTVVSLRSLAATMHLALERLHVGEILVERRSERRLRLMLQYASDVICILDHDLTVVHVTAAVEPIVGLPAPELLGLNWLDLLADVDRDAGRDLVSLAQGGRPARGELRLNSEDGHVRHVDAVVTEVIDEDLMGFVVTCHDITARFELEQQLTHQAFHDSLTGLANRALFRDRLGHAMARARNNRDYAVLFIDLDDFKTVNDSLGHAAGDHLLKEMTARLRTCLRDGDTAARLGGDEFAVLLEDVDDDEHCTEIAQRVLEALGQPYLLMDTEVSTASSIGIAVGLRGPESPEDLMRNADLALYDAKNAGKNRYAVYAPAMHEAALARLSLTSDLRHALERDEFVVHYQPLVALDSSEITGLEALVRWNHPTLGLLPPGRFIALAEETGLIVPLGRAVLERALQETVRWQQSDPAHAGLRIAVNVSGRQLADEGIVEDVRRALATTGIPPETVVLEITESVLLPGDGVIVERLHALSNLGVQLYIDDFGTGYSSLSYLQMLPVNGLKLAQEFVEQLPGTDTESGLVRTIKDLASTLGLSAVVAEGIERTEQWDSLLEIGYQVGQGYHLAVPMPAERIPTFLTGLEKPGDGGWERQKAADLAAAEMAGRVASSPHDASATAAADAHAASDANATSDADSNV